MRFFLLSLLSVFFCFTLRAQLVTGAEVAVTDTESGKVRGYISDGIYTYKGIPYGQAERFAKAEKPEPWTDVRSSMTYGPVAPLLEPTTSVRDEGEFVFDHNWGYPNENCLVLNVWTPRIDDGKKRPVMFWIHGGGFTSGSSQELPGYDGENLARSGDVVVVSINHRLNLLGFLDLSAYGEEYETSANNSILDIKLALEWVRDNVSNFGGDPDNVTIFGQSGGGAKVNTLMAMPEAKGLFHKAINQSGSFRSNLATKELTQRITKETVAQLGLEGKDVVVGLKEVPFAELSEASSKALKLIQEQLKGEGENTGMLGLSWGPSVDGKVLPHQFLSQEALAISKDVPLLIGTVKNEFAPFMLMGMGMVNPTEEEVMSYIKKTQGDKADAYVAAVKEAYPNAKKPIDLIAVDMMFRPGTVYQANLKADLEGSAPVYMYLFTWESPVMDNQYKSIHCVEIPFVFNNIELGRNMVGTGADAHALAKPMHKAWVNFARTGNPNAEGLPQWDPYTTEKGATMMLDTKSVVRSHPDKALLGLTQSGR